MAETKIKPKRQGYKTIAKQLEADRRYLAKNPERQKAKNYNSAKSTAKRFVKLAKLEDLLDLQQVVNTEVGRRLNTDE